MCLGVQAPLGVRGRPGATLPLPTGQRLNHRGRFRMVPEPAHLHGLNSIAILLSSKSRSSENMPTESIETGGQRQVRVS